MREYSEPVNIQSLGSSIGLSSHKLYQLANHYQKFISSVRTRNNQAKELLDEDRPKEALPYILQAEKILQYGASCGKNIDRNLIVCVLQNQACCYQKIWELQKCCSYLQALIFNISEHLNSVETSSRSESIIKYNKNKSCISELTVKMQGKPISQRMQLCCYQLQYCAINSQTRNHKNAYLAGKKVLLMVKSIFKQLRKISMNMNYHLLQIDEDIEDIQSKIKVINGLSSIQNQINVDRIDDYIITAKYYFRRWNIRKLQEKNQLIKQSLKHFSIGSIMQIKSKLFQDKDSTVDFLSFEDENFELGQLKSQTYAKVINKALFLSVSYFTVATQLRLMAIEKYKLSEENRIESIEFKESQIYHLVSLILTCIYIPFDMMYVRHILSSFTNHYNIDLSNDGNCYSNNPNIMKDIFDKDMYVETIRNSKNNLAKRFQNFTFNFQDSIRISQESDDGKKKKRISKSSKQSSKKSSIQKKGKQKQKKEKEKKIEKQKVLDKSKGVISSHKKHRKVNSEFSIKKSINEKIKFSPQYQRRFIRSKSKTMKNSQLEESYQFNDQSQQQYFLTSPILIKAKLEKVTDQRSNQKKNHKRTSISKSKGKSKKLKQTGKKAPEKDKAREKMKDKQKKSCLVKNIDKYYF